MVSVRAESNIRSHSGPACEISPATISEAPRQKIRLARLLAIGERLAHRGRRFLGELQQRRERELFIRRMVVHQPHRAPSEVASSIVASSLRARPLSAAGNRWTVAIDI